MFPLMRPFQQIYRSIKFVIIRRSPVMMCPKWRFKYIEIEHSQKIVPVPKVLVSIIFILFTLS